MFRSGKNHWGSDAVLTALLFLVVSLSLSISTACSQLQVFTAQVVKFPDSRILL